VSRKRKRSPLASGKVELPPAVIRQAASFMAAFAIAEAVKEARRQGATITITIHPETKKHLVDAEGN